jgi:cell division protease FtsH
MPDNETKKPRRQLKNIPPDRFQPKVLIFWIYWHLRWWRSFSGRPGITVAPAPLTIFEVVTHAESGDIKTGMIQPDPSGGRDWVSSRAN